MRGSSSHAIVLASAIALASCASNRPAGVSSGVSGEPQVPASAAERAQASATASSDTSAGAPTLPPDTTGAASATGSASASTLATADASSSASSAPESGTRVLPNGLLVKDLVVGSGPAASRGAHISVRYTGKLAGGTVFDEQKNPVELALGKHLLIEGWEEGLLGMKVGGRRRLVIPPALGYGSRGSPPKIPANAITVFEIELLGVK